MSTTMLLPYTSKETQEPLPNPVATPSLFDRHPVLKVIRTSAIWLAVSLCLLASFGLGYIQAGVNGVLFAVLALLPIVVLVGLTLLTVRRYELSVWERLLALVWGGVGSIFLTFFIIDLQNLLFGASEADDAIVVQAAIVEEFAKGFFLIGLLVFAKPRIRNPLSGAMLGVLVGAGFAFTENILYFSSAYHSGGWDKFWETYFLRAVQSFFLHSLATMFTGMFIGYVVSRNFRWYKTLTLVFTGLLSAMTVHGMWNGMASLTHDNSKWMLLYFLFWLPFLSLMVTVIVVLYKKRQKVRKEVLQEAADAGFIREKQAVRLMDRKSRKKVYKQNRSRDVIQWERSLDVASYWNVRAHSLNPNKRSTPRKKSRYQKKQTKELMKLSAVIETV